VSTNCQPHGPHLTDVPSLMDGYDKITTLDIASLNSLFFDLLSLQVSEMLSSRHASSTMDGLISSLKSSGFRDSHIVRLFPLNPRLLKR
jgi:hypothetical protein